MEAEFVAFSATVQEAICLKRFLVHVGVFNTAMKLVIVYYDSHSVIAYTKDPKYHGNTKHIDIKYNFIREIVPQKKVNIKHISTQKIVIDPFTKPITKEFFCRHVKLLGS